MVDAPEDGGDGAGGSRPGAPDRRASRAIDATDHGGVSGRMTMRVLRLLEDRGHPATEVCRRWGLPHATLVDPDARVDYATSDRLVEAAVTLLGAEGLGLAIAGVHDDRTYDAAGFVLMTAATFGEGLERAFAYQRLWGDGERFTLHHGVDEVAVRFRHPGSSDVARAVLSELALLETLGGAKALVDPMVVPVAVTFAHAPLGPTDALCMAFGVEPVFGAAVDEIRLPRELVDRPMQVPRELLLRAFDRQAQRSLEALPERPSFAARVRAACEGPDGLSLDVGGAARRLRVSPRTLQRRLSAEATTFAEVIDGLRRERVERLLARGGRLKEVAFLVGFADASALTRARARWAQQRG